MPTETIDDLVGVFVELRDELSKKKKELKEFEANQKVLMEDIECKILEYSRKLGVRSFGTKSGVAFLTEKKFVRVGNWETILEYIKESGNWQMLEKRIGKLATLEILDDPDTDIAPQDIGVEYVIEEVIQVRRS